METLPPPLLCGEAQDTEAALCNLDGRYRDTVKQFWMYEGMSLRRHANKRGLKDYRTFEVWLVKGHELLKAELARLTAYHQARAAIARAAGAGA